MYKTISVNNSTYQELNMLASRLQKPKAQIIEDLVKEQAEKMQGDEKKKTEVFDAFVAELAKKITLPKGTKIKSEDLDKSFAYLKDIDY